MRIIAVALLFASLPLVSCRSAARDERLSAADEIQQMTEEAALGDRIAQYNLGVEYYRGDQVPQDYAKAAAFWRLAAQQGDPDAMNNLGFLMFNGLGVEMQREEAVRLWRQAARAGQAESNRHLGYAAEVGEGTARDWVEAYARYRTAIEIASQAADPVEQEVLSDARASAAALRKRLSPEEIRAAEAQAQVYLNMIRGRSE